jgi:hypothetical protein
MLDGFPGGARKLRDIIASRAEQSARDIQQVHTSLNGAH